MDNLIEIITMPDNIPIIVMVLAAVFFSCLSFSKALKNDRLINAGKKEDIIDEMQK
jgi:hypothetical protein